MCFLLVSYVYSPINMRRIFFVDYGIYYRDFCLTTEVKVFWVNLPSRHPGQQVFDVFGEKGAYRHVSACS